MAGIVCQCDVKPQNCHSALHLEGIPWLAQTYSMQCWQLNGELQSMLWQSMAHAAGRSGLVKAALQTPGTEALAVASLLCAMQDVHNELQAKLWQSMVHAAVR